MDVRLSDHKLTVSDAHPPATFGIALENDSDDRNRSLATFSDDQLRNAGHRSSGPSAARGACLA